jgi:hypothetical protein
MNSTEIRNFDMNQTDQEDEFEFDFAMCHGSYECYPSYGYRRSRDKHHT